MPLKELLDLDNHAGSVDPVHEAHAAAEWSAHMLSRQGRRHRSVIIANFVY